MVPYHKQLIAITDLFLVCPRHCRVRRILFLEISILHRTHFHFVCPFQETPDGDMRSYRWDYSELSIDHLCRIRPESSWVGLIERVSGPFLCISPTLQEAELGGWICSWHRRLLTECDRGRECDER